MKNVSKNIFPYIYTILIGLLITGIFYSLFLISASEITLALVWLIEGKYKEKFKKLKKQPYAMLWIAMYLLLVIGMLYTTNIKSGLNDLQVKLPMLVLPIIFATTYPTEFIKKYFNKFYLFLAFIYVLIPIISLSFGWIDNLKEIPWYRNHIRASLLITIAISIILFANDSVKIKYYQFIHPLLIVLFITFQILNASLAPFILSLLIIFIWIVSRISKRNKYVAIGAIAIFIISPPLIFYLSYQSYFGIPPNIKNLENIEIENRNVYNPYALDKSLVKKWNEISTKPIDEIKTFSDSNYYALVRFLASKNYPIDTTGLKMLNDEEIKAIENNITNYRLMSSLPLEHRLYNLYYEIYRVKKDKQIGFYGSLSQRLVYLKAGITLINEKPFFGWGTGDVSTAFKNYYQKYYPQVPEKLYRKTHNQFVTIGVALGIVGMLLLLILWFYPIFNKKSRTNLTSLWICIWIIFSTMMLLEDMLEGQQATTMTVFFLTFYSMFWQPQLKEN